MTVGTKKGSKRQLNAVFARNKRIQTHPCENTTACQHISSRGHFVNEVAQSSSKLSSPIPLKPYQPILEPLDEAPLEDDTNDTVNPNRTSMTQTNFRRRKLW